VTRSRLARSDSMACRRKESAFARSQAPAHPTSETEARKTPRRPGLRPPPQKLRHQKTPPLAFNWGWGECALSRICGIMAKTKLLPEGTLCRPQAHGGGVLKCGCYDPRHFCPPLWDCSGLLLRIDFP
jgi:hypothetical protein